MIYFLINNINGGKGYLFSRNDEIRGKSILHFIKMINSEKKSISLHKNETVKGNQFLLKNVEIREKKVFLSQNEKSERKSMRGNAGKIRKFILPVLTQEIFDNFSLQPVQSAYQINIYIQRPDISNISCLHFHFVGSKLLMSNILCLHF